VKDVTMPSVGIDWFSPASLYLRVSSLLNAAGAPPPSAAATPQNP
jgi:hypothetical protein